MHKAKRKEIKDLNEGAVFIDHSKISVTYRHEVNTAEALNVSAENFRIIASYLTAPPTLITLSTKTFTYLQQSSTVFDTAEEEVIHVWRLKIVKRLLFQMQTSIIVVLLLSSGFACAGLGNLLRLAEFIADIYQQFPHSCIFIMDSEAQKGKTYFYIIYSFVFM